VADGGHWRRYRRRDGAIQAPLPSRTTRLKRTTPRSVLRGVIDCKRASSEPFNFQVKSSAFSSMISPCESSCDHGSERSVFFQFTYTVHLLRPKPINVAAPLVGGAAALANNLLVTIVFSMLIASSPLVRTNFNIVLTLGQKCSATFLAADAEQQARGEDSFFRPSMVARNAVVRDSAFHDGTWDTKRHLMPTFRIRHAYKTPAMIRYLFLGCCPHYKTRPAPCGLPCRGAMYGFAQFERESFGAWLARWLLRMASGNLFRFTCRIYTALLGHHIRQVLSEAKALTPLTAFGNAVDATRRSGEFGCLVRWLRRYATRCHLLPCGIFLLCCACARHNVNPSGQARISSGNVEP